MVRIEIGKYKFKGERSWDECSSDRMAELSLFPRISPDKDDNVGYAIAAWLKIPGMIFRKLEVDRYQFNELKKQLLWMFKKSPKKPFPYIQVGNRLTGTKLYLPAPEFEDTTSLELAMAFIHYTLFAKGEEGSLDKLITTLCREKSKEKRVNTDDIREEYSEYCAEKMALKLTKVPIGVKMAFLNYFECMLEDFMATYREVFGSGESSRYDSGLGMIMVLKSVAQQGYFGTYDDVCKKPVNLFWTVLLDDVLTQREQEEKYAGLQS